MSRMLVAAALGWGALLSVLDPFVTLDMKVQDAVQAGRGPALEGVMKAATGAGRREIVLGTLLGIAILGGPAGVVTARQAVIAVLPANLIVDGVKWVVARPRPDGDRNRKNASFPSGHAAGAFALAAVFARRWRRWTVGFMAGACLVAFSRMYLNRHFLSDVLVGAGIGLAMAWMAPRWGPLVARLRGRTTGG